MLSWAQAQQTVKLIRGQSVERFTIADELLVSLGANNQHNQRDKPQKTPKKAAAGLASSKSSFDLVDHWQKSVEEVLPPPDAQQESYVCDEEVILIPFVWSSKPRIVSDLLLFTGSRNIKDLWRKETLCKTWYNLGRRLRGRSYTVGEGIYQMCRFSMNFGVVVG